MLKALLRRWEEGDELGFRVSILELITCIFLCACDNGSQRDRLSWMTVCFDHAKP